MAVTTYGYDTNGRVSSLGLNLSGTSHDVIRTISRNQAGQITQRTSIIGAFEYPAASSASTLPKGQPNHLNQLTTIGNAGPTQVSAQYDAQPRTGHHPAPPDAPVRSTRPSPAAGRPAAPAPGSSAHNGRPR